MKPFTVYLVMSSDGRFFGPGGWVQEPKFARMFDAEDAVLMLRALPQTSAISCRVGDEPQPTNTEEAGVPESVAA